MIHHLRRARREAHGHYWTLGPALIGKALGRLRPTPGGVPWSTELSDPDRGRLRLRGVVHRRGSSTALVVLHGLGGSADSFYVHHAAKAALAQGLDVLRLSMRGASGRGADVYHGALTADLHVALRSLPHRRLLVLGVSIGGHLSLSMATEEVDPRLGAVAALCPPVDLALAAADIDQPSRRLYRDDVLASLVRNALPAARRGELAIGPEQLAAVRSIREWDDKVVVPRFGFASVDAYYRTQSVAPRLSQLRVPTLLLLARHDPMILARSQGPVLQRVPVADQLTVRWLDRGGHVGFPRDVSLGFADAPRGIFPQIVAWLRRPST